MGIRGVQENAGEALRLLEEEAHPFVRAGIEQSDAWQVAGDNMCKVSDLTEQHMASIKNHLEAAAGELALVLTLNETRASAHSVIENDLFSSATHSLPHVKKTTERANRHLTAAFGEEAPDLMGDPSPLQGSEQLLGQTKEAYDKARRWRRSMAGFHREASQMRDTVAALAETATELAGTATANRVTPEGLHEMSMQEPRTEVSGVYARTIEAIKGRIEGINQ